MPPNQVSSTQRSLYAIHRNCMYLFTCSKVTLAIGVVLAPEYGSKNLKQ